MRRLMALMVCASLSLAACSDSEPGSGGPTGSTAGQERELVVSAAASLTDAFGDIGAAFEEANPGVTVTYNFGPSDGLATQINEGAPVDVFASASPAWMDVVQDEGPGVTGRTDFARNEMAVIVPTDNPAGIGSLEDLANEGVKLVLAAEGVPAGDYAREVLDNAGIADAALANVVSNAEDVRSVVTTVASGEADAGMVYVTDVTADVAEQVSLNEIPDDVNVLATYPIAVVVGTEQPELAGAFLELVLGDGQSTLAAYGFLPAE
ncbi:MAG TPA: molybdate ABC transporter substrate-binding protein [Actinomycetota bacterium]|nr:molybdate ABC transporter substrate-binding protein [Actinomycetota bacterium]